MWKQHLEQAIEVSRKKCGLYAETGDEYYDEMSDVSNHESKVKQAFMQAFEAASNLEQKQQVVAEAVSAAKTLAEHYGKRREYRLAGGLIVNYKADFESLAKKFEALLH